MRVHNPTWSIGRVIQNKAQVTRHHLGRGTFGCQVLSEPDLRKEFYQHEDTFVGGRVSWAVGWLENEKNTWLTPVLVHILNQLNWMSLYTVLDFIPWIFWVPNKSLPDVMQWFQGTGDRLQYRRDWMQLMWGFPVVGMPGMPLRKYL